VLVGRVGLVRSGENDIEIADWENFFFINYINRGAISSHSVNFVINIIIAEITNTY
jgi:hypothetical protein